MGSIKENFKKVKEIIAETCIQNNRSVDEVTLIAVTKTFPATIITESIEAGHYLFAENKVQEAIKKREALGDLEYEMHLIGHLQSNKARKAVEYSSMIHSIDTLDLISRINTIAQENNRVMPVLLQVNTSNEEQKSGFEYDIEIVKEALHLAKSLPNIDVRGLMTMGPLDINEKETRRCFSDLQKMKEQLTQGGAFDLPHLSMGMSHDYQLGIAHGATYVRVGQSIYGARLYPV